MVQFGQLLRRYGFWDGNFFTRTLLNFDWHSHSFMLVDRNSMGFNCHFMNGVGRFFVVRIEKFISCNHFVPPHGLGSFRSNVGRLSHRSFGPTNMKSDDEWKRNNIHYCGTACEHEYIENFDVGAWCSSTVKTHRSIYKIDIHKETSGNRNYFNLITLIRTLIFAAFTFILFASWIFRAHWVIGGA